MKQTISKIYYKNRTILAKINFFKNYTIYAHWNDRGNNFGDILNNFLISKISGKNVFPIRSFFYNEKNYFVIGSILQFTNNKSIVWGSGFISEDIFFKNTPQQILAVRGPLTRKKLLDNKIDCPEIYGDPALLLPKYYNPKIKKTYKIGIIPHYMDFNSSWVQNNKKSFQDKNILLIDLINPNPLKVIDLILSCELIMSSSLHGLIISDTYKIPSIWISFSDKIVGGNFKFYDYFLSVGKNNEKPVYIDNKFNINKILSQKYIYSEIDIDLDKLLSVCPFKESK